MRLISHSALLVCAFWISIAQAQSPAGPAPYTTWSDFAGSADSMQYSALTQINKTNVSRLELAWFYPVAGQAQRLVFNPLVVDDMMYVLGERGALVALDAATGKELWANTNVGSITERGITYWENKDRSDRRLVLTSRGAIREVNAQTGEGIQSFGESGRVEMRNPATEGGRPLGGPSRSPPRIFENLIITGSIMGEGYGAAPGDLRAYDVLTGDLVWIFHTIPQPGEYGFNTWPSNMWRFAGGANTWGGITVDKKHGIVFFPTGSPTADLYGSDRAGANLFGNCLIALDARTGKRLWHFQTVHHDVWDYDQTAAPNLLTVRHNGKMVDVVAQAGKTGFLYVFERTTGKPLWPIEERRVPPSEVPAEKSFPTQPFPTKPPAFGRQKFTEADINPYVDPKEKERIREFLKNSYNEGTFTGSSHRRYYVEIPGAWGGANWGVTAADPETGMVFVRTLQHPSTRIMESGNRGGGQGRRRGDRGGGDSPSTNHPGAAFYLQLCANCHGPGMAPIKASVVLNQEIFRAQVRQGREQMPPFTEDILSSENLDLLEAYLRSLAVREPSGADSPAQELPSDDAPLRLPPSPNRYSGPALRYNGSQFAAAFLANNGLSAISPPWTELVAYDLNEGTIKWRIPDGTLPGLVKIGITNTGGFRPRSGPVPTAGGLVFAATAGDRTLRAYDKDTGKMLWAHEIEGTPEGIPAVYQVRGRQYVAFAAGAGTGYGPAGFTRIPGKIEAQGYHVFALPETPPTTKE